MAMRSSSTGLPRTRRTLRSAVNGKMLSPNADEAGRNTTEPASSESVPFLPEMPVLVLTIHTVLVLTAI